MKISFISCSEQEIDFLPELEEFLVNEVMGLETETFYVPTVLDIPLQAKQVSSNSDLVFTLYSFEKEDKRISLVLEKLLKIELDSNTRIVKAIEETEESEILTEEDVQKEKERLVKKWGETIINLIHFPEKFKPGFEETEE